MSTERLIRHAGPGVVGVRKIQVPHSTRLGQNNQPNNTTRATIPLDRLLQCTAHKVDALLFCHLLPPVRISITVDVGRARAADRKRLLVERSAQRNRVYLATVSRVVSGDDNARTVQRLLVYVIMVVDQMGSNLRASLFS